MPTARRILSGVASALFIARRIQKSCNDIRQELDDLANVDSLQPGEYQELIGRIDAIHSCATMVLRRTK